MQKGKNTVPSYKQGSVWWGNLNTFGIGKHIERGFRPYIIVSRNVVNRFSPNVTVVPCTTSKLKTKFPSHVIVSIGGEESIVLCEQVLTVGKDCFSRFCGNITDEEIKEVTETLKTHFKMEV